MLVFSSSPHRFVLKKSVHSVIETQVRTQIQPALLLVDGPHLQETGRVSYVSFISPFYLAIGI